MGFISNVFDVTKLARNLDRKPAVQDRVPRTTLRGEIEGIKPSDLDSYLYENVFLPILTDEVIPIGRLDLDRISEEDIEAVSNAFYNCNFDLLNFCLTLESFPASAAKRRIMI